MGRKARGPTTTIFPRLAGKPQGYLMNKAHCRFETAIAATCR